VREVRRITRLVAKAVRYSAGGFTETEKRILIADLLALAADIADGLADKEAQVPLVNDL